MNRKAIPLCITYSALICVMFILPFYSSEEYLILKNTTSHLGAQQTPHSWIMNAVFMLLGFTSLIAGWQPLKHYGFHKITLLLFCFSLVMVAIFQHRPIDNSQNFSVRADQLHSVFATTTGITFTLFAFATIWIVTNTKEKVLALSIGLIASGLSILMFQNPDLMGIWQRALFVLTFAWLLHLLGYSSLTKTEPKK